MKNRINNILKVLALVSFAMFQLFGCKQIDDIKDSEKVAYITINNSLARSAMPELSIEKMTNFVLKGTFSGEEEQELGTWDNAKSLKTAKILIKIGLWDFKLTAQQDGISFSATIEKKQILAALNNLEFNLSVSSMDLQNGKGSISINIKNIVQKKSGGNPYEVYFDIIDLEGNLKGHLAGSSILSKENTEGILQYYYEYELKNYEAGTYFIDFEFYAKGHYLLGTYRELVNVIDKCTSYLIVENLDLSNTYEIKYNLNGGKWKKNPYYYNFYSPNDKLENLPDADYVKKSGYSFAGWYENEDFSGEPVVNMFGRTNNKILYAKWEPTTVKYKVQYRIQGIVQPDEYFVYSSIYESGITEDYTKAVPIDILGFSVKEFEQQKIVDEWTCINIDYDRNDITLILKLNGGNINGRTEDFVISGKYGSTYTADNFYKDFGINYIVPQKNGVYFESYNTDGDFLKKNSELEFTFPAYDTICSAKYSFLDYRFKVFNNSYSMPSDEFGYEHEIPFKIYPFCIGETEVTYEIWYKVQQWAINTYPERYNKEYKEFKTIIEKPTEDLKNKPISNVYYLDALLWCNAASEMCGLEPFYKIDIKNNNYSSYTINIEDGESDGYRLPVEEEWEFAARGGEYLPLDYYGNNFDYDFGFNLNDRYYYYKNFENIKLPYFWKFAYAGTYNADKLPEYAIYNTNFIESIKSKKPNSVGLYDMSGNVSEYTNRTYGHNTKALDSYLLYKIKGGAYNDQDSYCEIVSDNSAKIIVPKTDNITNFYINHPNTGFRLARSVIE